MAPLLDRTSIEHVYISENVVTFQLRLAVGISNRDKGDLGWDSGGLSTQRCSSDQRPWGVWEQISMWICQERFEKQELPSPGEK